MAKRKKQQVEIPAPVVKPPLLNDRTVEYICVALILIAASLLMLMNIGNQYLWQDEAQTACISKTVLQYGVPHGFDGNNYFSQEGGAEYGPNYVWRWHTWLPFYVLAGFFAAFGESTLVARLPFSLFGIATVLMCYYLGKRLWKTRRAGVLAAALLMLSIPFLLLVRQCRYYSMTAFFTTTGIYAYLGILEGRKRSGFWFALSGLLLFHTHYLYYAILTAATFIHILTFHRSKWMRLLVPSVVVFLLNLPVMIWLADANFSGSISYVEKSRMYGGNKLTQFLILFWFYTKLINARIFPVVLLIVPAVVFAVTGRRKYEFAGEESDIRSRVWLLLTVVILTVLACAISSPYPYFRYLVTLAPVCLLLVAYLIDYLMRVHWSVALLMFCAVGFTRYTPQFAYELTHDYDGPIEGIVKYLRSNAKDDDIVVALHEDMPLKFYLRNRVYGGLTGEDMAGAEHPKWIIFRNPTQPTEQKVLKYVTPDINAGKYGYIRLDGYPNLLFENREDIKEHAFRTVMGLPVYILKRMVD